MLSYKQIRKLVKPYSNKDIGYNAFKGIRISSTFWSNGLVAFFEEVPKTFENIMECNVEDLEAHERNTVEVWPVELRISPLRPGGEERYRKLSLQFMSEKGHVTWYDAKYVRAILKRRPDKFFTNSAEVLMARRKGETIAILVSVKLEDPPWVCRLRNEELPELALF